jgi:hypothetical protein
MKKHLIAVAIAASALGYSTFGQASERCNVPMSDWQPREALQQKLEEKGWQVHRIKTDDGCYKAYVVTDNGDNLKAYFDPKTLVPIKKKDEDRDD